MMKHQIKSFMILISILVVSCEKSKYSNYQKQEVVKIVNKDTREVVINTCLITSLSSDFQETKSEANIKFYNLFYQSNVDLCNGTNLSLSGYEAVVVIQSPNCGMIQQKANARALNIKLLLYITPNKMALPDLPSELSKGPSVVLMTQEMFNSKHGQLNNYMIGIYSSDINAGSSKITEVVTFSLVVVTILLTMGCTIGFTNIILEKNDAVDTTNIGQVKYLAIIMPIFMIAMLLLLYFFFFVMVWLIIMAFYFLSAYCLAGVIMLFVEQCNCLPSLKKPFNKWGIPYLDYRFLILYILGLVISTVWIVFRNTNLGLVLNNVMGVYVCIEIAITLALTFVVSRNFKILLVILTTVLVLDAVMVYVKIGDNRPDVSQQISLFSGHSSLYRTKRSDGNSIMESVATAMGGSSHEEIPIRFKIPRLEFVNNSSANNSCQPTNGQYSMIGFGDLILPGAFIVYMLIFAVVSKSSVVLYFLVTFIGYVVGLLLTYVAVSMSMRGQPALVFLLPCTVVPTLLVTVIRGEFMSLWHESWFPERFENRFDELDQDNINTMGKDGDVEQKPL